MSPQDVKNYFFNGYRFRKITGMSASTFSTWIKRGRVPLESQVKLHKLTHGILKANLGLE